MSNTEGLNLSNAVCSECGYIHPMPKDGICPMSKKKDIEVPVESIAKVANVPQSTPVLNNTNNIVSKNKDIQKILIDIEKLLLDTYNGFEFSNEYSEGKFFKIIYKNIEVVINEYKI